MTAHRLLDAALMGLVEGLTEFLPVSSTGHLILAGKLLAFDSEAFIVLVQFGALAALWWTYRERIARLLWPSRHEDRRLLVNLALGSLPGAIVGLLVRNQWHLGADARVIAWALIAGGVAFLLIERRKYEPFFTDLRTIRPFHAIVIGLAQCLALIPGVSRSGPTILGGVLLGMSRPVAAEFSFLLALPAMTGAALLEWHKHKGELHGEMIQALAAGLVCSYAVAWVVLKWFPRFARSSTFVGFGWYRIVFGLGVLAAIVCGVFES